MKFSSHKRKNNIKSIGEKVNERENLRFSSHKGQLLATWTTMLVVMVGVAAIIIVMLFFIFAVIRVQFGGGAPMTYEVINAFNHPYSVAEILTHYRPDDRNVIEQAIESSYAGSLENAQAQRLDRSLKLFLEPYGFAYYEVTIADGKKIMRLDSAATQCGDGGVCTYKYNVFAYETGTGNIAYCNVGRIEISGTCLSQNTVCCKNVCDDPNSNECQSNKAKWGNINVIKCGSDSKGTCSARSVNPKNWWEFWRFYESGYADICGEGRVKGDSSDCEEFAAPLCCKKAGEAVTEGGLPANAVIPLLYKGKLGYMTVTINAK